MAGDLRLRPRGRDHLSRFISYMHLAKIYVQFNFKSALEYRAAFVSQVLAMLINDCFWLIFWLYFFKRFPVLGGWDSNDVVTMWAIVAAGFGLAHGIAGNAISLSTIIMKGQLDTWLLYPRAILPHLLVGKMSVTSWGDVLFGVIAYAMLVHPSIESFLLFILLCISIAFLFIGFGVLVGSLGFFMGNSEGLSEQLRFALVTFSTYPPSVFDNGTKIVLYTLIPAGFCSFLPVEALKQHSLELTLYSFVGSLAFLAIGTSVFYFGLKRYESGNLMEMRG